MAAGVVLLALAPLTLVAAAPARAASGEREGAQRRGVVTRLDRALVEAAEDGDVDDVTQLLVAGADVNATVEGDGSPLIMAARGGHESTVTLLLDRGADVNLAADGDGNPLIMAAREGHLRIVELLLDRGATVDQVVPSDENALIQASGAGHLEIVQLLVSRGADVNARVWAPNASSAGGEWRTPLAMARRGNHREVTEFLMTHGARQ